MLRYVFVPIGTFAVVLLLCVAGTLRDTGGTMPGASTLAGDLALAYAAAALLAVAMFLKDYRMHGRRTR